MIRTISVLSFLMAAAAAAQELPRTVLVLDASGSMWGQIDGTPKIAIAQSVIGDLLTSIPENQALGLTVYGHRRKGDCTDIETLIEAGTANRDAIRTAVNAVQPKGKTPMTAAVLQAARALRHTEEAATVILVSDGIETCEADPCAVAAELEASGVDFTAHVIGFDVKDEPEAQAQMRCIAERTGGRYLTADSAEDLARALTEVAAAPPPPAPSRLSFSARERFGTETRPVEVVWEVLDETGAIVMDATQAMDGEVSLPPGTYTIRAMRLSDETVQQARIGLGRDETEIVALTFDAPLPPATLSAPSTGAAGATIAVEWTGPDGEGDYVDTARADAGNQGYITYANTRDGTPMALRLPAEPGDYVIRYIETETFQVLASIPITVTPAASQLSAPSSARIGGAVPVVFAGDSQPDDYVTIAEAGSPPGHYLTYFNLRDGHSMELRAPTTPGDYEIRHVVGQNTTVRAQLPLRVEDVPATLNAAARVAAGEALSVAWTGPDNPGDYITITAPGDGPNGYVTYEYTEAGSPLNIPAPDTPGSYVLRYVADGPQSRVLVEIPLTVE